MAGPFLTVPPRARPASLGVIRKRGSFRVNGELVCVILVPVVGVCSAAVPQPGARSEGGGRMQRARARVEVNAFRGPCTRPSGQAPYTRVTLLLLLLLVGGGGGGGGG